jgi:hypothetical protein
MQPNRGPLEAQRADVVVIAWRRVVLGAPSIALIAGVQKSVTFSTLSQNAGSTGRVSRI